jgi:hypothetical protein
VIRTKFRWMDRGPVLLAGSSRPDARTGRSPEIQIREFASFLKIDGIIWPLRCLSQRRQPFASVAAPIAQIPEALP